MQKRWTIRKHDAQAVNCLSAELGQKPLVAALLIARGYDTIQRAEEFLNPSCEHLHEPFLMKGMRDAVTRIQKAIDSNEKILIWGDYDVDGTTGTVLLRKALHLLGATTSYHLPNRFTEGYGINIPALKQAKEDGNSLVVSVDCGIRSFEPLDWAAKNALDVVITDHHLSDEIRGNPIAAAVVNPNQPGCPYPDKTLAGVGVAFKLAHALLREKGLESEIPAFLKIAAIGTVADIMDLTGENRAIVALGLRDLSKTSNVGLRSLMNVADCKAEMTSYDIGFRIGPRINAAGRMDVANHVIELLEETDPSRARQLAMVLDSKNRERQAMQQKITELALKETESHDSQYFVVVSGDNWHKGVIGLAASRIADKLYRPTIVLTVENGIAHGSARSIPNYNLIDGLDSCSDLFEQFGGHAAAAGLKMREENICHLRGRLNDHAGSVFARDEFVPELKIDAVVTAETLGLEVVEAIKALEPFGAGNPRPRFLTRGLMLRDVPYVMKDKHLKLRLSSEGGKTFEAVWWDGVDRSKGQTLSPDSSIELVYVPEANVWQGNKRLQLVIEDLRVDNYK